MEDLIDEGVTGFEDLVDHASSEGLFGREVGLAVQEFLRELEPPLPALYAPG